MNKISRCCNSNVEIKTIGYNTDHTYYCLKCNKTCDIYEDVKSMDCTDGKCDECTYKNCNCICHKEIIVCDHVCSGNCRRVGCNCECGEWHNEEMLKE